MANIFLTPSIIAKEALIVLENNLVFGGLVHRAYDTEYHKVDDTIRIRVPATFESKVWAGSWSAQDISEKSVSVKLDT
ncbi:P22 coat protein, partial [Candidatus Kaiserbacteria bacterium CG17_big_fil_post_rev_8_21_14_2_50_51_7]